MIVLGTDLNFFSLLPPIILLITASVTLILALFIKSSRLIALLSLAGVGLAFFINLALLIEVQNGALSSFGGRYIVDIPAAAFSLIIMIGLLLAILISFDFIPIEGLDFPEYYPLLILSSVGAVMMPAANDLIVLILALEIMSLAVYVLSAWDQDTEDAGQSEEAGMKYFLLGAFASAFFIYGIALMYGATGSFSYATIVPALAADGFSQGVLASLAALLILAGLGFKVGLAPFHQWAPDVYTGAPTAVTAFMSVVVKTAAIAALLRFVSYSFPFLNPALLQLLAVLIAVTLIVSNFAALVQPGVKRMLAYSAVAHAGYLGMAVLATGDVAAKAVIWYMMAYTFMNIGAFAVLALVSRQQGGDSYDHFAGLGKRRPFLAAAMTVFLLSLAGIPPLAGFFAKVVVFQAALSAGYAWLAVVGIITSIVAVVYYVRVIITMYSQQLESFVKVPHPASLMGNVAVLIALIATIGLGLMPNVWYRLFDVGKQLMAGM